MNYLQAIVGMVLAGILLTIWYDIRGQRKEMQEHDKERDKKINEERIKIDDTYLKQTDHALMCENSTLKLKTHISEELTDLKDGLFKELREVQALIKNNGR